MQVDHRLVAEGQLVPVDGTVQPRGHLQLGGRLDVGRHIALAAGARPEPVGGGPADDRLAVWPVRRMDGHARAGGQVDLLAAMGERHREQVLKATRQRLGHLRHVRVHLVRTVAAALAGVGHEHQELVAPLPCDQLRAERRVSQPVRELAQQLIACDVAEAVVDQREVVEAHEQHGGMSLAAGAALDREVEPVAEQLAVGEAGQLVVPGEVLHALLGPPALGDVLGDDGQADHTTGWVAQQRLVAADDQLVAVSCENGGLEAGIELLGLHRRAEPLAEVPLRRREEGVEPVPSDQLLTRPAGEREQVVVAEGDAAAAVEHHGDQVDALEHLAEPPLRLAHLLLRLPPRRHVLHEALADQLPALLVEQDPGLVAYPDDAAVLGKHAVLDRADRAKRRVDRRVHHPLVVVGVQDPQEEVGPRLPLLRRVAQDLRRLRADEEGRAELVHHVLVDDQGQALDQSAVPLLGPLDSAEECAHAPAVDHETRHEGAEAESGQQRDHVRVRARGRDRHGAECDHGHRGDDRHADIVAGGATRRIGADAKRGNADQREAGRAQAVGCGHRPARGQPGARGHPHGGQRDEGEAGAGQGIDRQRTAAAANRQVGGQEKEPGIGGGIEDVVDQVRVVELKRRC